jgi:aminoglycoside phosphotransferase (APT) family kinase protein
MADPHWRPELATWLEERCGATVISVRRLTAGHSRAMWVADTATQSFVVRVEQGGVFATSSTAEYAVMQAVGGLDIPIAAVRFVEPTGAVIGHPFFVMDRLVGVNLGVDERVLPDSVTRDCIGQLQRVEAERVPHHQIERWLAAAASVGPLHPLLTEGAAWLHHRAPTASRVTIVHGDPGPGNLVHDGTKVVAFTDWEFTHLGDPMEDWVFMMAMRGARMMGTDAWRTLIADEVGVTITDEALRYWTAFNFFKGACANLTCLRAFAGANPAPNMAIIGTALQQLFMRRMVDAMDS